MVKYKVAEIKPDTHFSSDVMLDSLFLLTTPPCAVTPEVLSYLKKWGFLEVFSEDEKILSKIEEDKNLLSLTATMIDRFRKGLE